MKSSELLSLDGNDRMHNRFSTTMEMNLRAGLDISLNNEVHNNSRQILDLVKEIREMKIKFNSYARTVDAISDQLIGTISNINPKQLGDIRKSNAKNSMSSDEIQNYLNHTLPLKFKGEIRYRVCLAWIV